MVSRWFRVNSDVAKTMVTSDYAQQLDFRANFAFYILENKLTIVSLADKEIE